MNILRLPPKFNNAEEWLDTVLRNWIVLLETVRNGTPGLHPEQEGPTLQWYEKDVWSPVLGLILTVSLIVYGGWIGFLFLAVSPAMFCTFLNLSIEGVQGFRVLMSRWYVAVVGIVLLFSGLPAEVRWLLVLVWAFQSWETAKYFASEKAFWFRVWQENPNPPFYNLHTVGWLYLSEGLQSQAEDEFTRVLTIDPRNQKAKLFMGLLQSNRAWHAKGYVGVSFHCAHCQHKDSEMLSDGRVLSREQHDMYFDRRCPQCGRISEYSRFQV